MADMQGRATERELDELFWELARMTEEERKNKPYALFIIGKGFLNGQEAFEYLQNKTL